MAQRASGSKLVGFAVAATFLAVGIETIYLPFFADRDKIRGMHEEKDAPTGVMLTQEIKKLQAEGLLRQEEESNTNIPTTQSKAPGSMWKRFSK
jgi:hypothetical protein